MQGLLLVPSLSADGVDIGLCFLQLVVGTKQFAGPQLVEKTGWLQELHIPPWSLQTRKPLSRAAFLVHTLKSKHRLDLGAKSLLRLGQRQHSAPRF